MIPSPHQPPSPGLDLSNSTDHPRGSVGISRGSGWNEILELLKTCQLFSIKLKPAPLPGSIASVPNFL